MIIEKVRDSDLDRIHALDEMVVGDSGRCGFLTEAVRAGRCWVARQDRVIAGFIILERSFYGHAFVSLVVVDPAYRRRGVATALIRRIESSCRNEKLFTSTNRSNAAMRNALEKFGFVQSGYIENLDEGDPEIVYFKNTGTA